MKKQWRDGRIKMKQIPIIFIQWIDAHGNTGWFSNSEKDEWAKEDWYTDSVGFLIKETDKMIVIAERHEPNNSVNRMEQWGGLHKIPKTWIKNKRILGYLKNDGTFIRNKK
jgi:hypothetical protein